MTVPLGIMVLGLLLACLVLGVVLIIRRLSPVSATRWAKVAAIIAMIVASVTTTLRVITCVIPGGIVQVSVSSVKPFWPVLPNAMEFKGNAQAKILQGGFQSADVFVTNAGLPGRIAMAVAAICFGLVVIALSVAVHRISLAIEQGSSFRDISVIWLKRCAWIVLIGGEAAALAGGIGRSLISRDLSATNYTLKFTTLPDTLFASTDAGVGQQVYGVVNLNTSLESLFELWPLLAGIGLLLLARIFDQGKMLQAETEGLV